MEEQIKKQLEQMRRDWEQIEAEGKEISKSFEALFDSARGLRQTYIDGIPLAHAMERIIVELQKDKEPGSYYHTWQCNIAMCFYDIVRHRMPGIARVHDMHSLANQAAIRFLEILCLRTNNNEVGLIEQSELQQSQPNAQK